jgi:hypothetical protein
METSQGVEVLCGLRSKDREGERRKVSTSRELHGGKDGRDRREASRVVDVAENRDDEDVSAAR